MVAASVGQCTWAGPFAHQDTIMHLAETETRKHGVVGQQAAILHCELLRRSLARKTSNRDPSITCAAHVDLALAVLDDHILAEARTRNHPTLRKAGHPLGSSASKGRPQDDAADSAAERTLAAMDSYASRAKEMGKSMQREQQSSMDTAKSLRSRDDDETSLAAKQRRPKDFYDRAHDRDRRSRSRPRKPKGGKGITGNSKGGEGKGGGGGGRNFNDNYRGGDRGGGGGRNNNDNNPGGDRGGGGDRRR